MAAETQPEEPARLLKVWDRIPVAVALQGHFLVGVKVMTPIVNPTGSIKPTVVEAVAMDLVIEDEGRPRQIVEEVAVIHMEPPEKCLVVKGVHLLVHLREGLLRALISAVLAGVGLEGEGMRHILTLSALMRPAILPPALLRWMFSSELYSFTPILKQADGLSKAVYLCSRSLKGYRRS